MTVTNPNDVQTKEPLLPHWRGWVEGCVLVCVIVIALLFVFDPSKPTPVQYIDGRVISVVHLTNAKGLHTVQIQLDSDTSHVYTSPDASKNLELSNAYQQFQPTTLGVVIKYKNGDKKGQRVILDFDNLDTDIPRSKPLIPTSTTTKGP